MLLLRLFTTVLVAIAVVKAAELPVTSTDRSNRPTSATSSSSSESRNGEMMDQIAEESSRVSEVIEAQEKSYATGANPPPSPQQQQTSSSSQQGGPLPIPVPVPVQVRPGALVLPSPGRTSNGNKPPNFDNYGPAGYGKLQESASMQNVNFQSPPMNAMQQQQNGPQQPPPMMSQNGHQQFGNNNNNNNNNQMSQGKNRGQQPQMIPPQLQGLPLAQLMPPQMQIGGPRPFAQPPPPPPPPPPQMMPQNMQIQNQNFAQLQSQNKQQQQQQQSQQQQHQQQQNNVQNEKTNQRLQQQQQQQQQQQHLLQAAQLGSEFGELGVGVVPMGSGSGSGSSSGFGSNFPGFPNAVAIDEQWQQSNPEMPQILHLEAKCEKNQMKVAIKFDKPFFGVIFSKGNYDNENCVYMRPGKGLMSATFDIAISGCGTTGNTQNGLYGFGEQSGSGSYFENTIVVQYDPLVQEVWDQARKLRCSWHDYYEKSVTFKPFNVEMLDIVHTDFAGDNVGCWMQIQVGKGPWANEVTGIVKIGQTMTMVLAIKDDENKFDMLVRDCVAHDGKRTPIELVDDRGCIVRPKLMSKFTKIKNFGTSASVMSYAHFQAFKFPDSMDVHFQCTIQICRYQCPEQCAQPIEAAGGPARGAETMISESLQKPQASYAQGGRPRLERAVSSRLRRPRRFNGESGVGEAIALKAKSIGVDGNIKVVSTGDLAFNLDGGSSGNGGGGVGVGSLGNGSTSATMVYPMMGADTSSLVCISTTSFTATVIFLLAILVISCIVSAFIYIRNRPMYKCDTSKSPPSSSLSLSCNSNTSSSSSSSSQKPKPMFYQFLGKQWKY